MQLRYSDLAKPGVEFRQERITAIDPAARHVTTDGGSYDADILVVALGAEYDLDAVPGFAEDGLEYYSIPGAERMRDALPAFTGGKILIGVLGQPYKCPPAPFEGAFLLHDQLVERGIREQSEIRVVAPMSAPVPVTPRSRSASSTSSRRATSSTWHSGRSSSSTSRPRKPCSRAASGCRTTCSSGSRSTACPPSSAESGLAESGWVAVDRDNLMTPFPDVYAMGDVVNIPMAKAGVFAENAAGVVADDIVARLHGETLGRRYEGEGNCFIEFGSGRVAQDPGELPRRPVPGRDGRRPVGGARGREGGVRRRPPRALVRRHPRVASFDP